MSDWLSHTKIQWKELIEWLLIEGPWNLIPETNITLNRTIMGCSQDLGIPTQFSQLLIGHVYVRVAQSCPVLWDPMDYSRPGSSVHGILQARILEWVSFSSPGHLPNPGIESRSPALQADYRLNHQWLDIGDPIQWESSIPLEMFFVFWLSWKVWHLLGLIQMGWTQELRMKMRRHLNFHGRY